KGQQHAPAEDLLTVERLQEGGEIIQPTKQHGGQYGQNNTKGQGCLRQDGISAAIVGVGCEAMTAAEGRRRREKGGTRRAQGGPPDNRRAKGRSLGRPPRIPPPCPSPLWRRAWWAHRRKELRSRRP